MAKATTTTRVVRDGGAPGAGTLYLVGTPIGNMEDITLRALRILKEVDLIACEDTRHTVQLLDHYGIEKVTVSYHEHNELTRAAELVWHLENGDNVAVVSDAGMPAMVSGSLTDKIGVVCLSTMAILMWRDSSVMMQKRVISDAVPAVVLIATSGNCGLADLSTPS